MVIAVALWVALSLASGVALTRLLMQREEWDATLGTAILLGISTQAGALFLMDLAGLHWSRPGLIVMVVTVTAGALAARRGQPGGQASGVRSGVTWMSALANGATIVLVAGYASFSVVSIGAENDYIGIWGVKARMFFEAKGLDMTFLTLPANDYVHPDYPVLLPLAFDSIALVSAKWDERMFAVVYPLVALATILSARAAIRREGASSTLTSVGTLALTPAALSPWIGLAEGPLLAFSVVGLLRARGALRDGTSLAPAAVLLGLGASVKNEGLALLVAAVIAAVCLSKRSRWRTFLAFWPAVAVIAPWSLLRSMRGLDSYFARGALADRVLSGLEADRIETVVRLIAQSTPVDWVTLVGLGVALAVAGRRIASEKYLLFAVAIQVSFFVGAYLISPFALDWHVKWSWERLMSQIEFPLQFVCIVGFVRVIGAAAQVGMDHPAQRHRELD